MRVVWAREARDDRADIWEFIAAESPAAAMRIDHLFSDAAQRLAVHPLIGKDGTVSGTRELVVHENYRLVYEINDDVIWVLALVHAARRWPPVR